MRIGIITCLGLLALNSASYGYIRLVTNYINDPTPPVTFVRTDNAGVQFLLNTGVTAGAQSSASGKTVISANSDPVAAVRAALATWSAVSTANVKFLPLKSTSDGVDSQDNKMVIAIGASASDLSALGGALAVTFNVPNPVTQNINGVSVAKGVILDSDIVLNPVYTFSTDGSTPYDLQSVLTHELGHALGANHTGLLGASMFQFNGGDRFLTSDDLAFLSAVYPGPGYTFGAINGKVTSGGSAVPYALLTAIDTSSGVSVGGLTATDGTYSFQVPPGNYQIYAEPLTGVLPINIYLSADQVALVSKFQTTLFNGSLAVGANATVTANIAVTSGVSAIATPAVGISAVNGSPASGVIGGPAIVPSGQKVDLIFGGVGFDATMSASNFTFYGPGISVTNVHVDPTSTLNGFVDLRVTLNVTAVTSLTLASFIVTKAGSTSSFSGGLILVPPTPTFTSSGVISAAPYTGIKAGVSPGGLYTIYDVPNAPNLGPAAFATNGPFDAYGYLATTLSGVSVTFDGVPAPMFLSYAGQLNFQVPFEVAGKATTTVIVNYLGSQSAPVSVPVFAVQPLFFTSDGKAVRALNHDDNSINSPTNPVAKGSYVEIYGTGVGKVSYGGFVTGKGAPSFPSTFTGNYTYSIGGSPTAPAFFGGWTVGGVGLAQWDLLVPANSPSGTVSVVVTDASGVASGPGTTIYVK